MKKNIVIVIILFFGLHHLFAQEHFELNVEVLNNSVNASFVELYLSDTFDVSNILEYDNNDSGKFTFSGIPLGTYQVTIKSLGFSTQKDIISISSNLSKTYSLVPLNESLDEIEIVALKDAIKNNHGDIKADVENSTLANQSNVTTLLQQLPKLLINTSAESVSVIGSGRALLYFDNQRITYQQLQAIPVNTIREIEIIQNPPAKYEADGQAVVIIHRKRNTDNGYNGSVSNMNSIRRGYNNHSSLTLNLKKNRWEFQSNANYNYQSFWEFFGSSFDVENQDLEFDNSGISKGPRNQFIGGVGVHYSISDEEYISTNFQATIQNTKAPITTLSNSYKTGINQEITTYSDSRANRHFISGNMNYNKSLRKGAIFVGLQLTDYLRGLDDRINNTVDNMDSELTQIRNQEFRIQSSAIRVDYSLGFGDSNTWEIGSSVTNAVADAFTHFNELISSSEFIRNYDYSELNLALYSQVSGTFSNVNYTLGFRAERNKVRGKFQEETQDVVNRDKINYFPNATLTFPIDSTNSIRVFYRSSINRPNYLNASSISTFISPYLEYSRNANLTSALLHRAGISCQKKRTSFALTGFVNFNPTNSIATYNEITERITLGPENLDRETGINLDINSSINYKSWNSSFFLRGTYSRLSDSRYELDKAAPYLYIHVNQNYLLPFTKPRITIGSVFWGLTPQKRNIIRRKGIYSLGMNLQVNVKDLWFISLHAHDILNTIQYADSYTVNTISVDSKFRANSRGVELMVRYNFGGKWQSAYKNRDIDDNLDRI